MELRDIDAACRMDEAAAVAALRQRLTLDDGARSRTEARARALAERVRAAPVGFGAETFLQQYGLSTREGTLLMCLAEALLRIPDADTAESLIRDKLAGTAWGASLSGEDFLMNAASWGLLLTGRLAEWREEAGDAPQALLHRTLARLGEPLARTALAQAMRILAGQGLPERALSHFERLRQLLRERGQRALQAHEPAEPRLLDATSLLDQRVLGFLCVPLCLNETVIGVLYLDRLGPTALAFDDAEFELVRVVARLLAEGVVARDRLSRPA